jgi:hypothetical protein
MDLVKHVMAAFVLTLFVGWLALATKMVLAVNRRIQRFESQAPGSTGMFGDVTPMLYALSIANWPLSLPVGLWLLRTPALARQGRISLFWFISVVTLFAALLCAVAIIGIFSAG